MLDKKDGWIKDQVLGGRMDFSARNVIVPDASLRAHQIKLPYLTFLELYKPEIINQLTKITGCSNTKAAEYWFYAHIHFEPLVYEVMNYLLKNTKGKIRVLINRNPTIEFGSIVCMEVVEVKQCYDDMTMSLPIQILSALNADFDGYRLAA